MISLVLPAFNPGPDLARSVRAVRQFVRSQPTAWEALFVLDGCTDGSNETLDRLLEADPEPRLRHIGYSQNRGKGYAVRTGLLAARGRYRLFTDIDLAYPFADVLRMADTLRDGADVAIADRDHRDSIVQLPPRLLGYAARRRVQSRLFGAVARTILGIPHTDTQAGLKGMTATVAETLVPDLTCDGFGFDCELLVACQHHGIPIEAVPVCVRYADAASSTGGLRTTGQMLRELWRIRARWHGRAAETAVIEPVTV